MPIKKQLFRLILWVCYTVIYSSQVSVWAKHKENHQSKTIQADHVLFESGENACADKHYSRARDAYEVLISQSPFGVFSKQVLLKLAYVYINLWKPEDAHIIAKRFIRLYPNDRNVDYAYYLQGIASMLSIFGSIKRYLPMNDSKYGMHKAFESFEEFSTLCTLFPNSLYAPDAVCRMIALKNMISEHELHIAHFYLKHNFYVSAIQRASVVVSNYDKTPAVEFALGILIDCFKRLNINNTAEEYRQVLQATFPNTKLLNEDGEFIGTHTYKDVNPSFLRILTFGVLDSKRKDRARFREYRI
ncbi:MAG: outer membrane protein assembly factor BamD [Endozoicomonadaceae bacterium]|nr:outer membrane protein assembly factor BamD [Endozoicomonadaceae bacterium]